MYALFKSRRALGSEFENFLAEMSNNRSNEMIKATTDALIPTLEESKVGASFKHFSVIDQVLMTVKLKDGTPVKVGQSIKFRQDKIGAKGTYVIGNQNIIPYLGKSKELFSYLRANYRAFPDLNGKDFFQTEQEMELWLAMPRFINSFIDDINEEFGKTINIFLVLKNEVYLVSKILRRLISLLKNEKAIFEEGSVLGTDNNKIPGFSANIKEKNDFTSIQQDLEELKIIKKDLLIGEKRRKGSFYKAALRSGSEVREYLNKLNKILRSKNSIQKAYYRLDLSKFAQKNGGK